MGVGIENLSIETAGTEEGAAEVLEAALGMEIEEEGEGEGMGKEGGDGTQRALEALNFLTQKAEPSGTTLADARNGFNKLIPLAILCTVRHRWPVGERFAFNLYRQWAQLLLRQPGGGVSYNYEPREGNSWRTPLSGIV